MKVGECMSFIKLYRIPFWARSPKSSWQVWRTECNLGSSRCNIFMQQQSARKYCTICWEVLHDLHGSIARYARKYCSSDLLICSTATAPLSNISAIPFLRFSICVQRWQTGSSVKQAVEFQRYFGSGPLARDTRGEGSLQQLAKYAQRQVQAQRQAQRQVQAQRQAQCQVCTTTDNHASGLDQLRKEQMCSSADPVFMTDSKRTFDNGIPQSCRLACSASAACATGITVSNQHPRLQNQKPQNKGLTVALNGIHAVYRRVGPCFTIHATDPPHTDTVQKPCVWTMESNFWAQNRH